MIYPFASLPENLAAFCRTLRRRHGFHIGPGELHDAARALGLVDLASEQAVRHVLRPILSGTANDALAFDPAFTAFFLPGPAGVPQEQLPPDDAAAADAAAAEPGAPDSGATRARNAAASEADADDAAESGGGQLSPLEAADDDAEASVFAPSHYSPLDADGSDAPVLPRVDRAWGAAARSFVRRLRLGLARRWQPARRGRRFDLRRTLRAGLQTGGEALSARWRRRPRRAPRLVLLIDGSRSMSGYTRTALQVAVALGSATTRLEVFTFSTRLQRVTGEVRAAAAGAHRRLDRVPHAWAGGTSIGACLREFLQQSGERLVNRDTVVVVASDGLDVGMPGVLRGAMQELQRRSAGVVWLNPLIDTDGYEPTAAGMRAARPYIATFTSVADAAGLARLARIVRLRS